MKHLIRRGLGVALAVVMATGLLSSCGSDYDPVQDIMGYKGSTVLFTVNGQDVTAEQYLFWLAQQADTTYSYASMMQSDDSETSFWDTKVDENSDETIADQVKAAAQNYAAMYSVVEAKGKEEGYSYTSEDKASYQEDLATAKEQLGGEDAYAKYLERGNIEVAPLAYMRGRTLDDSFIILDEAQNTSCEQMKMFLTRMGFGSKMVITGDATQIDLPADKLSGLKQAVRVLKNVEGIGICELTDQDVVRHVMVQRIIKAYADYEDARNEKRKR